MRIRAGLYGLRHCPTQAARTLHPTFITPTASSLSSSLLQNQLIDYIMADPSGAAPQPGPDDTSTAILRPKKSYVLIHTHIDASGLRIALLQAKPLDCRRGV